MVDTVAAEAWLAESEHEPGAAFLAREKQRPNERGRAELFFF